jgi:hypothetical protein
VAVGFTRELLQPHMAREEARVFAEAARLRPAELDAIAREQAARHR